MVFFDKETGEMADSKTLTVAEVLEYEKLRAEAEEGGSNLLTVFIALSVILAAVAAGLCAYIFRLKKKE